MATLTDSDKLQKLSDAWVEATARYFAAIEQYNVPAEEFNASDPGYDDKFVRDRFESLDDSHNDIATALVVELGRDQFAE